jgi:hypothetical protein
MLRFVIGLGSNSLSGKLVERALSNIYPLDDFEIIPMIESEDQPTDAEMLQARAIDFAERVNKYPAEAYFGVAGGKLKFCFVKDGPGAYARADMVAATVNWRHLTPQFLHPEDISWQLRTRVCAHVSTDTAISDLVICICKHCTIKALPKPSR